jgi:Phosphate-selective porin O and P
LRLRRPIALLAGMGFMVFGLFVGSAAAQVTPAAGYTPPDDTPAIRLGMTLFPAYVYQTQPEITDADGNSVDRNAFDVLRAYINITGQISHLVAFRITPDITRQSSMLTLAAGNTVSQDSLVFRIKYAYAQFNLDDWMTRGSWVRLGIQQTPWVDFEEGIYRYRFQGTVFAERVPLPTTMTSADAGVSFHYNFASNYGDVHFGLYNGENYQRVEVNDQKGFEFRGTLRPFARAKPIFRGLRAHFVWYADHYASGDDRDRVMGNVTYEHNYIVAGFDYLNAKDQPLATAVPVSSNGYSIWATPRLPRPNNSSWEALLRYDHWTQNTSNDLVPPASSPVPGTTVFDDQKQNRVIFGVAYWFPHQGNVSTAILVDYDGQSLDNIITRPTKTVSVHGLLNF